MSDSKVAARMLVVDDSDGLKQRAGRRAKRPDLPERHAEASG